MAGRKGEKIWADAVRRAVMRRMDGSKTAPQKLEKLADALVTAALSQDISALREIGDRLDGKATQGIAVEGELVVKIGKDDSGL
jgi:hypothetical protein